MKVVFFKLSSCRQGQIKFNSLIIMLEFLKLLPCLDHRSQLRFALMALMIESSDILDFAIISISCSIEKLQIVGKIVIHLRLYDWYENNLFGCMSLKNKNKWQLLYIMYIKTTYVDIKMVYHLFLNRDIT